MKMVKSLLLGSAAGLVAVAGAQAADLPVKAKAVEYVKVCSAYGAGYFYIPGTDTCIKIGGYARFDAYVNAVGTFNPYISSASGLGYNGPGSGGVGFPFRDADDSDYLTRVRGTIDFDARTQTDYGTLRSYVRFGMEWNSQQIGLSSSSGGVTWGSNTNFYFERAFIQFSGFTAGYTQSFFDLGLNYMLTTPYAGSNQWTTMLAYTAQFGNGFSATLSLEDAANRVTGVQYGFATVGGATFANVTAGVPPIPVGFLPSNELLWTGASYYNAVGGQQAPDIVANLRVDQAWGSAQLSGALHQVNTADVAAIAGLGMPAILGSTDTWGWAIGGGVEIKTPFLAAGDSVFFQAGYADGALSYLGLSGTSQGRASGLGTITLSPLNTYVPGLGVGSGAYAPLADALLSPFGTLEKVSGWSLQGQFRHYWTPALRSAIYAGYVSVDTPAFYPGLGVTAAPAVGVYYAPTDVNMWQVGANTVWSPVKNLDIAAEVLYSKVDLAGPNQYVTTIVPNGTATPGRATALDLNSGTSADIWSGGIRVQRNF